MQFFLLTHQLYFMHEFTSKYISNKENKNDFKFYRISKLNHTNITEIKPDDIKNIYEEYWNIIRDIKNNRSGPK